MTTNTTPSLPLSAEQLDKLEELARAATPGPWMRLFGERTVYDRMEDGCRGIAVVRADMGYGQQNAANLDFIAAANPVAVQALIAQARTVTCQPQVAMYQPTGAMCQPAQQATGATGELLSELDWCIKDGCSGDRTRAALTSARAAIAQQATASRGEPSEQVLRAMFQRDAETFLGSPMVACAPGFQKDDDGDYQYANTRRLFAFWQAARASHGAQALPSFTVSRFSDTKQRGVLVVFDRKLSDDEVETVRAALANRASSAKAMRKCSKFGHRCNCATDCDPSLPHPSVTATPASDTRAAVPDGWKLVPVEATPEMLVAAREVVGSGSRISGHVYSAMLAAAPTAAIAEADAKDDGAAWREGVLMAVSVLISTHDQPTMGADVLNELGLRGVDCSALDDFDKRNLRKVQKERKSLNLRGLTNSTQRAQNSAKESANAAD